MLEMKPSDQKILRVLLDWNYNAERCTQFKIRMKTGLSKSTVWDSLKRMEYLGWIVKKTRDRKQTIFINEGMRPSIKASLGVAQDGA